MILSCSYNTPKNGISSQLPPLTIAQFLLGAYARRPAMGLSCLSPSSKDHGICAFHWAEPRLPRVKVCVIAFLSGLPGVSRNRRYNNVHV